MNEYRADPADEAFMRFWQNIGAMARKLLDRELCLLAFRAGYSAAATAKERKS